MATKVINVDPVSRISGLLSIQVTIENKTITDARSGGMQIRGFENMLQDHYPLDTIRLTSRTCGICSCAHSVASSMALEMALGVTPDYNGQILRDLALGFETLQNNIRQMYMFLMPDYVELGNISPLYKTGSQEANDYRLPEDINNRIADNYFEAVKHTRNAHKALAVLAGKVPHTHGIFVGGITTNYDIRSYTMIRPILEEIDQFLNDHMQEDLFSIMKFYPEYNIWGKSYDNYLSYGFFNDLPDELKVAKSGVYTEGKLDEVDISNIRESLAHTWLQSADSELTVDHAPPALDVKKPGAYSWVEAPRYKGMPYEVGPLADMIVNGMYTGGTGTMHRVFARYLIMRRIIDKMFMILELAKFQPADQEAWNIPDKAEGYAAIGAPRGGLLHWLSIENKKIKNYTLLPPSTWNMSPKDNMNLGAVERALVGTPVDDITKAETIVGRIVRSFDPCLNCAAHVVSDKKKPFDFRIV